MSRDEPPSNWRQTADQLLRGLVLGGPRRSMGYRPSAGGWYQYRRSTLHGSRGCPDRNDFGDMLAMGRRLHRNPPGRRGSSHFRPAPIVSDRPPYGTARRCSGDSGIDAGVRLSTAPLGPSESAPWTWVASRAAMRPHLRGWRYAPSGNITPRRGRSRGTNRPGLLNRPQDRPGNGPLSPTDGERRE